MDQIYKLTSNKNVMHDLSMIIKLCKDQMRKLPTSMKEVGIKGFLGKTSVNKL